MSSRTKSKALPPLLCRKRPCFLETLRVKLETEWLLFSEQGHFWGGTVSQDGDLPVELTVDRVAAALQDLHQHLKQTQQDLVMCV